MAISGIGGTNAMFGVSTTQKSGGTGATADFKNFMNMSPAERILNAMLNKLGISKEQFDAMPAAEQAKILDKIKQEIQAQMQEQTRSADKGEKVDIYA